MNLRPLLFLPLAFAGCSLIKTSSSTSMPTSSPTSSTTEESAPSSASDEPEIIGLSIDDAKKKIKAHGFDGEIEVITKSEFDASCKANTVCGFDPRRWYLNMDHRMALYVNRSLDIGAADEGDAQ